MSTVVAPLREEKESTPEAMSALVLRAPHRIALEQVAIPHPEPDEALVRVLLTTICGTDVHILRGEYPVPRRLILGHEAVGLVQELGTGVTGYEIGDRVLIGAITPCGQCSFCLSGHSSQCGGALGGWKLGNTRNGAQAEFMLVPYAMANMAKVPPQLSNEEVVLLADVASTGLSAAESANLQFGDSVAVFAQGPIGLCATAGARLRGAGLIIAVESDPNRAQMAFTMGANFVLDPNKVNPVSEILRHTDGRGVDVAIEALGTQATFEAALRVLRPGGTLSSLGVYAGTLTIPQDAFGAGLADYRIVTTLCPGGKERMRRLMELVQYGRLDVKQLLTHNYPLSDILAAYDLFAERGDGVIKVGIHPQAEQKTHGDVDECC